MKLYHNSQTNFLEPCQSTICGYLGHEEEHICFATQPISGLGPWLLSLDFDYDRVARWEYENLFRPEEAKFFAIPMDEVLEYNISFQLFKKITGHSWNQWSIDLVDMSVDEPKESDTWGLVWTSRPGVVSASILDSEINDRRKTLTIQIEADAGQFNPTKDYIIVDKRTYVSEHHRLKENYKYYLIAGNMPDWAVFPWAYAHYVHNEVTYRSAIDFILEILPELKSDIDYALKQTNKTDQARAWRIVIDKAGRQVGQDFGRLDGRTWTQVRSMPIRLASRLGPWVSPRKRPVFSDPDESGRILIASPEGVYPTRQYTFKDNTKPLWRNRKGGERKRPLRD